jgi:hypothetical protein
VGWVEVKAEVLVWKHLEDAAKTSLIDLVIAVQAEQR